MPTPRKTEHELPTLPAPDDAVASLAPVTEESLALLELFERETAGATWDAGRRAAVFDDVRYSAISISAEEPQIALTRRKGDDDVSGMLCVPFDPERSAYHWSRDPLGLVRWIVATARAAACRIDEAAWDAHRAVEQTAADLSMLLPDRISRQYVTLTAGAGPWPCDLRRNGSVVAGGNPPSLTDTDELARSLGECVPPVLVFNQSGEPDLSARISLHRMIVAVPYEQKSPTAHARAVRAASKPMTDFVRALEARHP